MLYRIIGFILLCCCGTFITHAKPSPKRELRGVWLSTIGNIDWPTVMGASKEKQQEELIRILDEHQKTGINALFFQIRPAADAFYKSSKEPWSRYLTGVQGKDPQYDPLAFIIEEAHKRGMELHAWINPYRASTTLNAKHFAADHITRTKPEWFFTYGGKKLFNPGIPAVRQHIIDVIVEVVKNYDVDGIHFDDYFYPYPDAHNTPIPDQQTYRSYGAGFTTIADWRRHNVDLLIQGLGQAIKKEKTYVKYGISPFGIWDNKRDNPQGSATGGLSGYRTLYADAMKWMKEGWIDYIAPQIYFPFQNRAAAYEVLVSWWQQHTYERHFYIGHGAYRVTENNQGWTERNQIPRQVRHLREEPLVHGSIYFSSKSLSHNLAGLRDSLQYDLYRLPALPPTMPWLDSIAPQAPFGLQAFPAAHKKAVNLLWQTPDKAADEEDVYGYIIYRFPVKEAIDLTRADRIIHISYEANNLQFEDSKVQPQRAYNYVVTAIDRLKNESPASNIREINIP